uniref:Nitrite oxidoreductase/nitrate reductase alpha subunit n=2 Tax=Candidatus Bipolaricaulota TaxID=67810 RepID=H5SMJ1_9BACT|nr:nitrite oxidoreductase/nitrate reductase alpha subunit [uncultured Acetothermia bacterium]BAL58893.1 nitrite oxidoreductase/nitrate reductase alpha subunit [Candidatus Acetothermum autotrophicum]
MAVSRRRFVKATAALTGAALVTDTLGLQGFKFVPEIKNPLEFYPNRDWEKIYRDQFRYDSSFTFLCAPNDTHNCLLRAYVRNGVIVRIGPTYGYNEARDLYGNKVSARWEPRCCQKGLALGRRFYGDRRVNGVWVRKGFFDWVRAGFPRDPHTGAPPKEYFNRGQDSWLKLSFDEAYGIVAQALFNIVQTYSGPEGAARLKAQNYDPTMLEAMHEAGTQTVKVRGGMPFLGATRIYGLARFANMLALLDAHIRNVSPDQALGGRVWDSYSWHTDLPPGHPMVTGQQTVEFDLFTAENAKLITLWGMNWICTKMPDAHWLTEARQRGAKVITIATEYQATANKADEVIIIRPGTDAAFALGVASVIINEKLYDEEYVKTFTDLPLLVRMDTLKLLRASDIIRDYQPAELTNYAKVLKPDEKPGPPLAQRVQYIPERARQAWGDFVVWDSTKNAPEVITRDHVGQFFAARGIDPALEGSFTVQTTDHQEITVRPVFDLIKEYLKEFTPPKVAEMSWAPSEAIVNLARQIAANKASTLLSHGMGPNHFFNADLKDRALFLIAALTKNIGHFGGSPGSYAGNYRVALFNGLPQYIAEDPFNIELDPTKPATVKSYAKSESAHYYNYGDRPLRVGKKLFTGKTHTPTPTKFMWFANSNSLLGNSKWGYDVIHNTLPKIEAIVVNEWWWTMSCEYADVVFGVDSWGELKYPDMCGSVTNPFVQVFPRTPLPRIFDTRSDIETYMGVAEKFAELTGDARFRDYWHFVRENRVDVYLQRICDASSSLRGYKFTDLEEQARQGTPMLKLLRTYPKIVGWEQTQESKPWYTKTGRLEFYREEDEFIEYGENLPVYREPVDATPHEPNVIVAPKTLSALKPAPPEQYGLKRDDLSTETRQVRNVIKTPEEVVRSQHPRTKDGLKFIFITPKYRHGAHTTPVDLDVLAVYFGPFGDIYRRDKRSPWVGEVYADINPQDAKELGIEDGDYIWIDADPEDRPYRGAKPSDPDYKIARLMGRARYYNGTPRGVVRMWFNMYQATHGTVNAHETRPDKLAKDPQTNYQAMFRYGGHQSCTRAWLRPTLMTDSLVRKDVFGQTIGQGFAPDIHCPVGAPKESFVKITRAEPGGADLKSLWRPAQLGYRPTYESDEMKQYLAGGFIEVT